MDICFLEVCTACLVPSQISKTGEYWKTETKLNELKQSWHMNFKGRYQPYFSNENWNLFDTTKIPAHCNFNPAFCPSPHLDHSTCGLCTILPSDIFLSCILFLNFWRFHAILTLSFEGVCGKKPYKVTLDLQSNSPFVGGSKKQFVRRILLSVRCYFASLFHATLHYFVHATCQEDNNVFGSTLKRLLLYWGKVSVVNPDCFGFACMYESLHLVSINGLTATHLQ